MASQMHSVRIIMRSRRPQRSHVLTIETTTASLAALLGVKGEVALRLRYLQVLQRISALSHADLDSSASSVTSTPDTAWPHPHCFRSRRNRQHRSRAGTSRARTTLPRGYLPRTRTEIDGQWGYGRISRHSDQLLPHRRGIPGPPRQLRAQVCCKVRFSIRAIAESVFHAVLKLTRRPWLLPRLSKRAKGASPTRERSCPGLSCCNVRVERRTHARCCFNARYAETVSTTGWELAC